MSDWTLFKRTFTQDQEDALWQYFIDHSNVQKTGLLKITFCVRDVNDFWRRVSARNSGEFKRYEKLEKQQEMEKLNIFIQKKMAQQMTVNAKSIDQKGSLKAKLILALYRKCRGYVQRYDGSDDRLNTRLSTGKLVKQLRGL